MLSVQHDSNEGCFDYTLVTSEKIGRGGKKDTLEKVVDKSCNLKNIDDNQQVLEECNQAGISVIGIIVPRRRGRAAGVSYVKHVCAALDQLGR